MKEEKAARFRQAVAAAVEVYERLILTSAKPPSARFARLRADLESAAGVPALNVVSELEERWPSIVQAAFRDDGEYETLVKCLPKDDPALSQIGLLELLGCPRREVLHTAALASFLDPSLSPAGVTRLAAALDLVLAKSDFAVPSNVEKAKVHLERRYDLTADRGRTHPTPDIVIELSPLVVVIENKVDAIDRPDQLSAYARAISRHYIGMDFFLVYLTPTGTAPTQRGGDDWISLSYRDLVLRWREAMAVDEAHGRRWSDAERAYLTTLVRSICSWHVEISTRTARTRITPYLRAAIRGLNE